MPNSRVCEAVCPQWADASTSTSTSTRGNRKRKHNRRRGHTICRPAMHVSEMHQNEKGGRIDRIAADVKCQTAEFARWCVPSGLMRPQWADASTSTSTSTGTSTGTSTRTRGNRRRKHNRRRGHTICRPAMHVSEMHQNEKGGRIDGIAADVKCQTAEFARWCVPSGLTQWADASTSTSTSTSTGPGRGMGMGMGMGPGTGTGTSTRTRTRTRTSTGTSTGTGTGTTPHHKNGGGRRGLRK